jgi:hypothetical protein
MTNLVPNATPLLASFCVCFAYWVVIHSQATARGKNFGARMVKVVGE